MQVSYKEDAYYGDLPKAVRGPPRVPRTLDPEEVEALREKNGRAAAEGGEEAGEEGGDAGDEAKKRGPQDSGKGVRIQVSAGAAWGRVRGVGAGAGRRPVHAATSWVHAALDIHACEHAAWWSCKAEVHAAAARRGHGAPSHQPKPPLGLAPDLPTPPPAIHYTCREARCTTRHSASPATGAQGIGIRAYRCHGHARMSVCVRVPRDPIAASPSPMRARAASTGVWAPGRPACPLRRAHAPTRTAHTNSARYQIYTRAHTMHPPPLAVHAPPGAARRPLRTTSSAATPAAARASACPRPFGESRVGDGSPRAVRRRAKRCCGRRSRQPACAHSCPFQCCLLVLPPRANTPFRPQPVCGAPYCCRRRFPPLQQELPEEPARGGLRVGIPQRRLGLPRLQVGGSVGGWAPAPNGLHGQAAGHSPSWCWRVRVLWRMHARPVARGCAALRHACLCTTHMHAWAPCVTLMAPLLRLPFGVLR